MKLKIIGNLIITIILVIIIDFFVSKVFKSEFSVYQDILTGIIAYIGGYFTTRKKINFFLNFLSNLNIF
ncbi:hypothetical protein [Fusobacterium animalis]|uniref:hypothetical protein n=1 Tax=Fusobacterium animalis TaxID=76859 RepID=UPI0030D1FB5D